MFDIKNLKNKLKKKKDNLFDYPNAPYSHMPSTPKNNSYDNDFWDKDY